MKHFALLVASVLFITVAAFSQSTNHQRVITTNGTITTQNLVPAGAATAGSAVEIAVLGNSTLGIGVSGTYTGALSVQVTVDGSNWVTIGTTTITPATTGTGAATIASAATGVFTQKVSGYSKARVTGLAAMTGTATVYLRTTPGE